MGAHVGKKLKDAAKALRKCGQEEGAEIIDRLKEAFPPHAKLRNRVAHGRCIGTRRSSPNQIVFLPYEREGPPGHLAIEIYELERFEAATKFARKLHDILMRAVDEAGFFDLPSSLDTKP